MQMQVVWEQLRRHRQIVEWHDLLSLLGDFSNQGCMFVSMGYDWAFRNCLKHGLVHGDIA